MLVCARGRVGEQEWAEDAMEARSKAIMHLLGFIQGARALDPESCA